MKKLTDPTIMLNPMKMSIEKKVKIRKRGHCVSCKVMAASTSPNIISPTANQLDFPIITWNNSFLFKLK